MSWKHAVCAAGVALGLIGSPAVRAELPAPKIWEGTIVGIDGQSAGAEVVAYARPSGLGLEEGSAPLREIARTRTDGSGRYVLRALRTDALRSAEDGDGWTNVMVAAFGDDGSFNLGFDSVSWVPAGGFSAAAADDAGGSRGRWLTTPAERLAAERGEIRALSADASEDSAEVAKERPTTMVLSGRGEARISVQGKPPMPKPADRNCMALLESRDLDVNFTKVGEVHAEREWSGYFEYTTTRSTSFQVGVRQGSQPWSVGGSTSSLQNSQSTTTSDPNLAPGRMYHFAADLKYGWYKWKCYSRDRWYEGESIQPYTWKGGLRQTEGGNEPVCNPSRMSPVPPGGYHKRDEKRSSTYAGGVSVAGFSGAVTTTISRGVRTEWRNLVPRERWLCGESGNLAENTPTRIRSLP